MTNPYRLPDTVSPERYILRFVPDLESATFTGEATIELDVRAATSAITFNALELGLGEVTVTDALGAQSATAVLNDELQTATVSLARELATGPATMSVSFAGILNDKLAGFYRSTFVDNEGVTQTIATTQLQATDARRAFPCWDEPIFKAVFEITLVVPEHLAAYSNSPVVSETSNGDGTRTVVYGPTMKMSTYIVAFVVGPFEATAAVDVDGVPLRVVYPAGKGHLANFALEAGAFALRWFTKYFDIPYPGDKVDMIAVPDFAFGAMENLGCITYRETALLVDPETASHVEIARVAEVVAHELAHMWFGDLVTMQWWEGIWLNEAFATFMATACIDAFRPEWKTWDDFGISRDASLQVDGLHSTRPIEFEVTHPAEAQGMLDLLTYEKGGSVLRMLEQFLGDEVYRDGIRLYLKKHAYANTVTNDLWSAFEQSSGQPVGEIMNTWILQGGHPLITIENGTISQSPFAYGNSTGESAIGSNWLVPLSLRSVTGGDTQKVLLRGDSLASPLSGPVLVNAGGSGVYRSRYGTAELAALVPHLNNLTELERATVVADAWAALFAGKSSFADFVAVAKGLGNLDEPATWSPVINALEWAMRAAKPGQRPALSQIVREILRPQFDRLGYDPRESDSELTAQVRAAVISTLGVIGQDPDVRAAALERFAAGELNGDTARATLRVVADQNEHGTYEKYLEAYRSATSPQGQVRFLYALADFPDPQIIMDAFDKCFTEFRSQDAVYFIASLLSNSQAGGQVWRALTSRWDEALARFPSNAHARMVGGIVTFITDADLIEDVEAFISQHPLAGGRRTVTQYLERLRIGQNFAQNIQSDLE